MRLSEELEQYQNSGDFGLALSGMAEKAKALENAFEKLIDLAGECDSWESFPSDALDEAYYAITNSKDKQHD